MMIMMMIIIIIILIMMMNLRKIRLLDLDKICVASNKVLVPCNGALWNTKNSLKRIMFLAMNIR